MAFRVYILFPLLSMLVQMLYYGILATTLGIMIGSMAMFVFVLRDQQDTGMAATNSS